jgi:hypothetical protein
MGANNKERKMDTEIRNIWWAVVYDSGEWIVVVDDEFADGWKNQSGSFPDRKEADAHARQLNNK